MEKSLTLKITKDKWGIQQWILKSDSYFKQY
jgi:hypothetical protein